jgi:glucokinase
VATGPAMKRHLVAFDVGGSKIAVLARDLGTGRDVHADRVRTPAAGDVEAVLGVVDAQLARLPGGPGAVAALGVAFAGPVDPNGRVLQAGNLRGWDGVPLRAVLEERYGAPAYVERDANCGAVGERWCGAAVDLDDFVFLSLGTGVGAGLFLGGRLHRGAHDAAGEAGDVAFPPRGTVGGAASKRAIKAAAQRAAGERMSTVEAFTRAVRDRELRRATRRPVESLAGLVIAIAALLDPEAILFGGGTSKAGEALLRRLRRRVPRHLARARLVLAGLGARSPLYGALWGAGELARGARERA